MRESGFVRGCTSAMMTEAPAALTVSAPSENFAPAPDLAPTAPRTDRAPSGPPNPNPGMLGGEGGMTSVQLISALNQRREAIQAAWLASASVASAEDLRSFKEAYASAAARYFRARTWLTPNLRPARSTD
jgi:hypothetical protein